jgi:hypothetical protein
MLGGFAMRWQWRKRREGFTLDLADSLTNLLQRT